MMELLTDPNIWLAFLTLAALEIILGIDNIIFISILVGRLPDHQRQRARIIGLSLAMLMRIGLLLSITWIMTLQRPIVEVVGRGISGRDLILILGGMFLLAKSVLEIHESLEGEEHHGAGAAAAGFASVIAQIAIIAVLVMMLMAKSISEFVDRHPTIKMLAMSFLVLIGTALVAEGIGFHFPKGYIYFAMAFSVLVEMLNIRVRRSRAAAKPVKLRKLLDDE